MPKSGNCFLGSPWLRRYQIGWNDFSMAKRAMNWSEYTLRAREIAPRGEAASNAKLMNHEVRFIRLNPHITHAALARFYGVSENCIRKVRRFETWVHVK